MSSKINQPFKNLLNQPAFNEKQKATKKRLNDRSNRQMISSPKWAHYIGPPSANIHSATTTKNFS
jgi:hypothetical protein